MIPLELNNNIALPIAGKRILGIQGLTVAFQNVIATTDFVPDLTGQDNVIYLLDYFHLVSNLIGAAELASIQITDFNDTETSLTVINSIQNVYPLQQKFSSFFTKKLELLVGLRTDFNVNALIQGYRLELVSI